MYEKISYLLHLFLIYIFRCFPVQRNKIVFSNMGGHGYGGIIKKISDEIYSIDKNIEFVWLQANTAEPAPNHIRKVGINSIKAIYELATAKIWINNCRHFRWVRKRINQYYIQTWHGDVCVKMVEKDAENTLPPHYIECAINDSTMADIFVSGSKWRTENYRRAFWYSGEIMKANLYLWDTGLADENSAIIRRTFSIAKEKNIALYIPTFRNTDDMSCYNMEYRQVIDALESKMGEKWVLLIRLHPNQTYLAQRINYDESIINATTFPLAETLIDAASVIITDYSGCMFQGFAAEKRVFIYASDYERYVREERGMYFDLEMLPAPFATTNEQLISNIQEFDIEQYEEKRKLFVDLLGYYEENGISQVASLVIEKIKEGNQK